jgi:putative OPT family oligopeptide transporter
MSSIDATASGRPANPHLASFHSYIPTATRIPELTLGPLVLGTILGMIFGASSLYLVLKVGLTVSASIPVAVISVTLFKILHRLGGRNATILENNIVQTAGSAGESIAFGVGVTMPAIMILGFDLEITRVMLVAVLGGLLGILMMIPLRSALIVAQHGYLKYPEGTACAEVLKAGASPESRDASSDHAKAEYAAVGGAATSAKTIFAGFGIGLIYQTLMAGFRLWKDVPEKVFGRPFAAASVGAEISPALLGVGYIIGPRIAAIMCAGGVLAYLVLIPMIKFFGDPIPGVLAPGLIPISEMSHNDIRGAYVLYIGAGAVAAGGIISVFRSLPMIWHGMKGGMKDVTGVRASGEEVPRTQRDLPMKGVIGGALLLIVLIAFANPLYAGGVGSVPRIAAAILIIIFGFLFVTVSSRLTGEIGSSSNPISGMTVATLLLTSLIFLLLGWTGKNYYVTALSLGAIVCIASSNGGTTSQALKTGHLLGATPNAQQIAILIGSLASALILGPILLSLNDAATVYQPLRDPSFRAPVSEISGKQERIRGPQADSDTNSYLVWHKVDDTASPAGKYFVLADGTPVYRVDPGINGSVTERPDGSKVTKFDAPKATLMSYIIKGILNRELPWGLVLLGVMIAVVLELAGIPSLAFAVGVYLPLSASSPILLGGIIRWAVDRWIGRKFAGRNMTEAQLIAEGDKSAGVLMASGYIAGGAIAGILIAFLAGVPFMAGFNDRVQAMAAGNPLVVGPYADILSMIPFIVLAVVLYLTGREKILAPKAA